MPPEAPERKQCDDVWLDECRVSSQWLTIYQCRYHQNHSHYHHHRRRPTNVWIPICVCSLYFWMWRHQNNSHLTHIHRSNGMLRCRVSIGYQWWCHHCKSFSSNHICRTANLSSWWANFWNATEIYHIVVVVGAAAVSIHYSIFVHHNSFFPHSTSSTC